MELKYKYILFDLDGTLTDPAEGITKSVQYALKKYGIEVSDLASLKKFIGPPLTHSFMEFYGFTNEVAKEAVEFYREYFAVTGIFENSVFPGVEELLKSILACGGTLYVATSKPTVFAKRILEHFNLSHYFKDVIGSNLDGTMVDKAEIIKHVLGLEALEDKSSFIMIGDREHDCIGAIKNDIEVIGVTFGYGGEEELKASKATYLARSIEDILKLLKVNNQ